MQFQRSQCQVRRFTEKSKNPTDARLLKKKRSFTVVTESISINTADEASGKSPLPSTTPSKAMSSPQKKRSNLRSHTKRKESDSGDKEEEEDYSQIERETMNSKTMEGSNSKRAFVPPEFTNFTWEDAEIAIEAVNQAYKAAGMKHCQHHTVQSREGNVCDCLAKDLTREAIGELSGALLTYANCLLELQKKPGVSKPEIIRRIQESVRILKNRRGSATVFFELPVKIKTESGSFEHRMHTSNISVTVEEVRDPTRAMLCGHSLVNVLRTMYVNRCIEIGGEENSGKLYQEGWVNYRFEGAIKSLGDEGDNVATRYRNQHAFHAHVDRFLRAPNKTSMPWPEDIKESLEEAEPGRTMADWHKSYVNHGLDSIHIIHPTSSERVEEGDYRYNQKTYELLKPGGKLQYLLCLEMPTELKEVMTEIAKLLPGLWKGDQGSAEAQKKQSSHNSEWERVVNSELRYIYTYGNGVEECLGHDPNVVLKKIKDYVKGNEETIRKADAALHNLCVLAVNRINKLMAEQEGGDYEPVETAAFQLSFLKSLIQELQDPHFDFPKLQECVQNFLMFYGLTESGMFLEVFGDGRRGAKDCLKEGATFFVRHGYILFCPAFYVHAGGYFADLHNKVDGNIRGHGYIFPGKTISEAFIPSNRYVDWAGNYLAAFLAHDPNLGLLRVKDEKQRTTRTNLYQKKKQSYLFFEGHKTQVLSKEEYAEAVLARESLAKIRGDEEKQKTPVEPSAKQLASVQAHEDDEERPELAFEEGWLVPVFEDDDELPVPEATTVVEAKVLKVRKTPQRKKKAAPESKKRAASPAQQESVGHEKKKARNEQKNPWGEELIKGTSIIAGSVVEVPRAVPESPTKKAMSDVQAVTDPVERAPVVLQGEESEEQEAEQMAEPSAEDSPEEIHLWTVGSDGSESSGGGSEAKRAPRQMLVPRQMLAAAATAAGTIVEQPESPEQRGEEAPRQMTVSGVSATLQFAGRASSVESVGGVEDDALIEPPTILRMSLPVQQMQGLRLPGMADVSVGEEGEQGGDAEDQNLSVEGEGDGERGSSNRRGQTTSFVGAKKLPMGR